MEIGAYSQEPLDSIIRMCEGIPFATRCRIPTAPIGLRSLARGHAAGEGVRPISSNAP